MKQIRFIPSGCQFWFKRTTAAADMQIEKVMACHERTISAISWSRQNPSRFASCANGGDLLIWDVDTEQIVVKKEIGALILSVEYAPMDADLVSVVTDTGDVHLYDVANNKLNKIMGYDGASAVRWNNVLSGKLAVATVGGMIVLYNIKTKKTVKVTINQESSVRDFQWEPNSENYLLVSWVDGSMSLIDGESGSEMQKFDKQGASIYNIAWLKSVPGGFITCNDKIPAFKIWSASNKSPLKTIKAGDSPVLNICSLAHTTYGKEGFLIGFKNGSVGVFNYERKAFDFLTQPNHSETIFDMAFRPSNKDILATGSYDGSIKIWEVGQMKCIMDLKKPQLAGNTPSIRDQVVYSIAWAPGETNQLVSVNSKGEVMLWDVGKGKLIAECVPGTDRPILKVEWSVLNPNLIAVAHEDGHCYILTVNANTVTSTGKFKHPGPVYGASWNPFQKNILATSCMDGGVRIWDNSNGQLVTNLTGHTKRSFGVTWNPLVPNTLASGSDDHTVRVWDTRTHTCTVLKGHTGNVRGLVWNTELPWLLHSGSWDSTIIMWDVRDQKPLHIATEHNADVYGIALHPDRPFVYVSCSRDTSVRFWSIEKVVASLLLRVVISGDWDDILGNSPMNLVENSELLKLCGKASKKVAIEAGEASADPVEYYSKILGFFSYLDYEKEFWEISKANLKGKTEDATNRVVSLMNLPSLYLSKAQELESKGNTSGFTYDSLNKKSDRILEAANMYLKLGEFELYCEALVKLGKWEKALAFAPSVSYDYWKNLAQKYAQELNSERSDETGSFYLLSGQISEAIKFDIDQGNFEDARLVAALKINNKFASLESSDRYQSKFKTNEAVKIDSHTFKSTEIREIISNLAEEAISAGQVLLAAAYHLSIKDGQSAVSKLLRGNEPVYAYAICKLYNLEVISQVAMVLAQRADRMGERFLGNILLNQLPDKKQLEIFCAMTPLSKKDANDLYLQNQLPGIEKYEADAQKCYEKGNIEGAVRSYVLSKNTEKACQIAMEVSNDCFKQKKLEKIGQLHEIFRNLAYAQINSITNSKLKQEVIAMSLYLGLKTALWKGLGPMVSVFHKVLSGFLVERKGRIDFPVPLQDIELEVANFEALQKPEGALAKLTNLSKELEGDVQRMSAVNMAKNLKEIVLNGNLRKIIDRELNRHRVYVPGGNLPNQKQKGKATVSILSGEAIKDEVSALTVEEALMWVECCSLSPMYTGARINPY